MSTRIWTRVRRWFGAGRSVPRPDLAFAHYGEPGERRVQSRSGSRREMLHPLKGWREETHDGPWADEMLFRTGLRQSLSQSVKRRADGRRFRS